MQTAQQIQKSLYDRLVSNGVKLPTYEAFSLGMSDPSKRKALYDRMTERGFKLPDYQTFESKIAPGATPPTGTSLAPQEEQMFQGWYRGWAEKAGIDPDPDNPLHKYDYRGAFKAGVEPTINPEDKLYHWPSEFKAEDHPNRFVGGVDTKTGKSVADPVAVDTARRRLEALGEPTLTTAPAVTTATTLTPQEGEPSVVEKAVMGVIDPVVEGAKKFGAGVKTLQAPTSGTDVLRGATDIGVGALESAISLIPAMAAINAGMAVGGEEAVKVGGQLISGVSSLVADVVTPELDKKILETVSKATGEKFTEKGLGYAVAGKFGLPVLVGAVLSDASGAVADKILTDTSLEEGDKKRISDLVHHTMFFAGMGGTAAAKRTVTGLEADIAEGVSRGVKETGKDLSRQQGDIPTDIDRAIRAKEGEVFREPPEERARVILTKPIPAVEEPSPIVGPKGEALPSERQRAAQAPLSEAERQSFPLEPRQSVESEKPSIEIVTNAGERRVELAENWQQEVARKIAKGEPLTLEEQLAIEKYGLPKMLPARSEIPLEGREQQIVSERMGAPRGTEQIITAPEEGAAIQTRRGPETTERRPETSVERIARAREQREVEAPASAEILKRIDPQKATAEEIVADIRQYGTMADGISLGKLQRRYKVDLEKAREVMAKSKEPEKPAELPDLKSSDEAVEYGRANPDRAADLEARAKEITAEARRMMAEKADPTEVMKMATRSQFAREAAEFARDPKLLTPLEKLQASKAEKPAAETSAKELEFQRKTGLEEQTKEEAAKLKREGLSGESPKPILRDEIPPDVRARIQDILDEAGGFLKVDGPNGKPSPAHSLRKAIEEYNVDKGTEASFRAQALIETLLRADQEGIIEVRPGKGQPLVEVKTEDLLAKKYERGTPKEGEGSLEFGEKKPGEPVKFEQTAAGEQGVLLTQQAQYPRPEEGIRSKIPLKEQIKGTMFEPERPTGEQGGLFPDQAKPDKGSPVLSIASIVASQGVDYLDVDDDTKKALKGIFGLAGIVGIASVLSKRGKEALAEIEATAKKKGVGVTKVIGEFMKSNEAKSLEKPDLDIFKKLIESPVTNKVVKEVARVQPKEEGPSQFKRVNDLYKRQAALVDARIIEAKLKPLTEESIQEIRGRTSAEVRDDPEFSNVSKSDQELIMRRLMKKINADVVPQAPRNAITQIRERLPEIETEVLLSTTGGSEAAINAIREKALEELRNLAGYSKLKPKTRATMEERLTQRYIEKALERAKKQMELQRLREQSIDRVAQAITRINKAKIAENVPVEMQNKLLNIAQEYVDKNINRGNQKTLLGKLTSMESALASTYGSPGGELFVRTLEGSSRKDAMVEVTKPLLKKVFEVYDGIKSPLRQAEIGDAVAKAAQDRPNAEKYLDTPQKKQAYEYTLRVLDYFKEAIEQVGRKVEPEYFPRIYDQLYRDQALRDLMNSPSEIREQIEKGAVKKGALLGILSEKTSRLKERTQQLEDPIKTDLRALLPSYVSSVSRELAFADAMQYFFEQFPRDIRLREVSVGNRPPMDRAIAYLRANLYPDYTTGRFFNLIQKGIANTYMAHLWNNLAQSAINVTQRQFTRPYMSPETPAFKNEFRGAVLPKRLASAIELATSEAPVRYGDLTPEEFEGSKLREKMAEKDTFRASERGNWYSAETDGVFDTIVKDARFKKLKEEGKSAEEIAETILSSPDAFDTAVRNAAVLSVRTQMSPSTAAKPELYRESAWAPLRVFTNYKRGAIQALSQVMGKWDGIGGARAQTIMARGMVGDVGVVEGLRFAETYNKSFKEMLKDPELKKALSAEEMKYLKDYGDHFNKLYNELNETVKKIEPLSGSKLRASGELVKYFGMISAISLTATLFFDMLQDITGIGDERERSTAWLVGKVFYDTFPMPFFGYNPANVFSAIPFRMFETTERYGLTKRNVAKDVVRYGGSAIFPPFGVLDRATGRQLSGAVVDLVAPKKTKRGR